MARSLTKKELAYIQSLSRRNAAHVKSQHQQGQKSTSTDWQHGKTTPMAPNERQIRSRIRRKAREMIVDIATMFQAGLLPDRPMRSQGVNSAASLADTAAQGVMLHYLGFTDDDQEPV